MSGNQMISIVIAMVCIGVFFGSLTAIATVPELGSARVVFQTNYGDIEFGFYHSVAPKTVEHIFKLVRLGGYNTNHFFRVDKGFVAQVADVGGGRTAPMNEVQRLEAEKTVVGEFSDVKHVRGILSMGRYSDPDSAQSSFSILLGDAPHLDGQYAIFGKVTKGDETLSKMEEVPTRKEGIFVMIVVIWIVNVIYSLFFFQPTERITIFSTYYYDTETESCEEDRLELKRRILASAVEIEKQNIISINAVKQEAAPDTEFGDGGFARVVHIPTLLMVMLIATWVVGSIDYIVFANCMGHEKAAAIRQRKNVTLPASFVHTLLPQVRPHCKCLWCVPCVAEKWWKY
ncbi:hypothetical protein SASPL_110512 [Salvia splendens]|uniref:PPIase cyclophilin-type domain-containing protein n=1 Tax=Salvia splendens TaxID=180675 RepID=A0A8X8YA39_SALSN|nr:hypothetical protein SASPL_110512 [Salvia splendens]